MVAASISTPLAMGRTRERAMTHKSRSWLYYSSNSTRSEKIMIIWKFWAMRAEKFHQFSGNWQAIKSLRTMSLGGLIVVLRNLPRSHWSQLWEWDLHSCRCFLIPWCILFPWHDYSPGWGKRWFCFPRSPVNGLLTGGWTRRPPSLMLVPTICNQNKFIFFKNYIFSNFFVQWEKKNYLIQCL